MLLPYSTHVALTFEGTGQPFDRRVGAYGTVPHSTRINHIRIGPVAVWPSRPPVLAEAKLDITAIDIAALVQKI